MYDVETCLLILAQGDQGPALPGEPATTTTGADGSTTDPAAGGGGAPSGMGSFLPILVMAVAAMLLISMFSQRKEKKRRATLLNSVAKHDKVQTIGGVVGSVVEVKNDTIVLKVDESSNTRITFARSAVQQVLSGDSSPTETVPLENNK